MHVILTEIRVANWRKCLRLSFGPPCKRVHIYTNKRGRVPMSQSVIRTLVLSFGPDRNLTRLKPVDPLMRKERIVKAELVCRSETSFASFVSTDVSQEPAAIVMLR